MTDETERVAPDDPPRVVAPPPLIYLGFILAGIGLDIPWPLPIPGGAAVAIAGGALIVAGVALGLICALLFRRAGTNIRPIKAASALVVEGPYRFSRNPIYVGLTAVYVGTGLAVGSVWILVLLIPALAILRFGVIGPEERYLKGRFGSDYETFMAKTRRWL